MNGARVAAGDVLVELDRLSAEADDQAARTDLVSARAEATRRAVAISAARSRQFEPPPALAWSDDIPAALREREEFVLLADLGQLAANLASLAAQARAKGGRARSTHSDYCDPTELVGTLQQRVDMRTELLELRAGSKAAVIDATETLQGQLTQLAMQQGQLASLKGGLEVVAKDAEKAVQGFISENAQKQDEAERQAEDLEQKLAKADAAIEHLTLRAPISGIVQASAVTTIGQVVSSGQEIMRIVSDDTGLEIEVYALNRDIGFVKTGQEAVVKIEFFPFTQYGTISAHVTRVARDAIPEPDANLIEGDPARAANSATFAGAQRTQNLVFPVTLRPDETTI